ncbi:response regulator receiver domain-containing protein [Maribacter caenipelagi]|uniref:Response regulator receiver domain-containing protein n=1 Tax=Maribacter caenipelagi TaxID=1447781 RepID=A0A4R7D3V0_9FLAO|nr:response regulator [Maribacter caenipelagi]TDS15137.1 response regulator receiver domain-containing protein [Maribacter caenipelagi]
MKLKEIMLVDDNSIDNYVSKIVVEKENFTETITVKSSAIEALDYLKAKTDNFPELIFLDIKMPIMDGFEFLLEFSKFTVDKKENSAIVMLSSSINNADMEAASNEQHVIDYLSKPLSKDKLAKVFDILIQKK